LNLAFSSVVRHSSFDDECVAIVIHWQLDVLNVAGVECDCVGKSHIILRLVYNLDAEIVQKVFVSAVAVQVEGKVLIRHSEVVFGKQVVACFLERKEVQGVLFLESLFVLNHVFCLRDDTDVSEVTGCKHSVTLGSDGLSLEPDGLLD
jgi:hypothetical protein